MSTINRDVKARIIPVKQLLSMALTIPGYQRPYKWQPEHVFQLLDDLVRHRNKRRYQLGTMVLYHPTKANVLEVVDGQQRLLTLTLIHHFLDPEHKECHPTLLER